MKLFSVRCNYCKKTFYRSLGRINEARKFRWKPYCSLACESKAKNKQKFLVCTNPECKNTFKRPPKEIKKVKANYCSHSCSAIVNNKDKKKKIKICANPRCTNKFTGRKKYCSFKCIPIPKSKYTKETVLNKIRLFTKENYRIPTKRDMYGLYKKAREYFGTWNNAIKIAGFDPNPVMFANKHISKDGHICDSLSEKIIDDWLYARNIRHKRNVPYPGRLGFTADFVVGDKWIEFFGLNGELKRYDELKRKKLKLVSRYGISLIKIYPTDIFPHNHLSKVLLPLFIGG